MPEGLIGWIAELIHDLSEIVTEVGVRLGYSYAEIAENELLGGADVQKYVICNQWATSDGLGHTFGYRYWVDVLGNDPAAVPAATQINCPGMGTRWLPPSWVIECPPCAPCCNPFANPDHKLQFVGNLGAGTVVGNLLGFPFMYDSGTLIVDIGRIMEQIAEALKSLT